MKAYRAAPSKGPIWIAVGTAVIAALAALPLALPFPGPLRLVMALVFAPFAVFGALVALWLPRIRYEMGEDQLVLRCGPFRWRIRLADIQEVAKRDLALNPISSFRGPGYALFWVPYADVGVVNMCATRSLKDIILITTSKRKYGITPLDEAGFLRELTARVERA